MRSVGTMAAPPAVNYAAAYGDLKPLWHLDKLQALQDGRQPVPAQVQMVISDFCNHDCSFCAYRLSGYSSNQKFSGPAGERNPLRMMGLEKALEILRGCAALGVGGIQFTGGGEPTVHPHHLEIVDAALNLGMKAALVTNGAILRPGWRDVLPRLSWMRVSLDAGEDATYAAIRGVPESAFQKTLDNLAALAPALKAGGCDLGVSFIVTRENYREVSEATLLAREAGVPSMRIAARFGPEMSDYYHEFRADALESVAAARELAVDGFEVVDMFSQRLGDLDQGGPDYAFCGYQYFNVYIGADLHVYRCCNTAYNERGDVGDLTGQTFLAWWNSLAKDKAYRGFDARACEHCAFNGKNRMIAAVTGPAPVHAEFA